MIRTIAAALVTSRWTLQTLPYTASPQSIYFASSVLKIPWLARIVAGNYTPCSYIHLYSP